jgi:hypothetical protein
MESSTTISLPLDVYQYLPTVGQFRLRDIIKLTSISKDLRKISLLEENWYIITDTKKILYDFIHQIFLSASNISASNISASNISYPFSKIRRMDNICCDNILNFNGINRPHLLPVIFDKCSDFHKFYECFHGLSVFIHE